MGFERVAAEEAVIVSGCLHPTSLTVVGPNRIFTWPFQTVQRISLKILTVNIDSRNISTSDGISVSCFGVAEVKIQAESETACALFSGAPESDIATAAKEVFEAYQNGAINSMTLEEIYYDRKKFCNAVFEAMYDLILLGISGVSFTLKTVTENTGKLSEIKRKREEEVRAGTSSLSANPQDYTATPEKISKIDKRDLEMARQNWDKCNSRYK